MVPYFFLKYSIVYVWYQHSSNTVELLYGIHIALLLYRYWTGTSTVPYRTVPVEYFDRLLLYLFFYVIYQYRYWYRHTYRTIFASQYHYFAIFILLFFFILDLFSCFLIFFNENDNYIIIMNKIDFF